MTFPTNSSCDGGEGRMGPKHLIISISIHVFLYSVLHLTRVSYQNARLTISFLPFGTHDLSQANFFCLIPQHSVHCTSHSATPSGDPLFPGFQAFACSSGGWTKPTPQLYVQFPPPHTSGLSSDTTFQGNLF